MRFAYADPPYPGMAHFYPENTEVNHAELFKRLVTEFPDGWALSTSSVALRDLLELAPDGIRIAAWVKSFAIFKPNVNPAYAWEPVIFRGGRRRPREERTARDWFCCPVTIQKGLVGAKPPAFCAWIGDLLGYRPDLDELVDLYPGTGIMGRVNAQHRFL